MEEIQYPVDDRCGGEEWGGVTCRYGQQGKGPGEEWSYGSRKEKGGETARGSDSTDCPVPELVDCPPEIDVYTNTDNNEAELTPPGAEVI